MTEQRQGPDTAAASEGERLQSAWTQNPETAASQTSSPPVEPEKIWAAVQGELSVEERRLLVDRLHEDPALALEWRLAMDLSRAEREFAETAENRGGGADASRRKRYVVAAGTVAMVFASAALVLLLVMPEEGLLPAEPVDPAEPVTRSPGTKEVLRSSLDEGESLPRAAFTLRWSSDVEVSHYELHVTTESLAPVFAGTYLEQAEFTIPAEALASVPAQTALLWRVEAIEADGTRHTSAVWRVVLR